MFLIMLQFEQNFLLLERSIRVFTMQTSSTIYNKTFEAETFAVCP